MGAEVKENLNNEIHKNSILKRREKVTGAEEIKFIYWLGLSDSPSLIAAVKKPMLTYVLCQEKVSQTYCHSFCCR